MDLVSLFPVFGNLAFTIAAFIVALITIIFVHEFGHYIVGRWSGIKAEVFSLGFGPVLWSRHDKHGTKWQIAAIPFGGFVKFWGDANAASGKASDVMETLSEEEKRHTMHGAPLWARAATVAAGPIFNFILAVIVYFALSLSTGTVREPLTVAELLPLPNGVYDLQVGDEILAIEEHNIEDLSGMRGLIDKLPIQETLNYTISRDGEEMIVQGPHTYPPMISTFSVRSPAINSDLMIGDVVTDINGTPISTFRELKTAVEGSEGASLDLQVWNNGESRSVELTPHQTDEPQEDGSFETVYRLGVVLEFVFEPEMVSVGLLEAASDSVSQVWFIITSSLSGLYNVAIGTISTCNMTGPIGIAETSADMASLGIDQFVFWIAFLSSAIGLMNLLPVPVLDGGHLIFHVYESITGKPPSDRVFQVLMTIGLFILLAFMAFAITNDVACSGS